MNKEESKYKDGKREVYWLKDESVRKANEEEITEKKQIRREER